MGGAVFSDEFGTGCSGMLWGQGMTGRGIQCSGLANKGLMGHRLDSKILEVFSSVNDSEIL